jgi:hypothetical protein
LLIKVLYFLPSKKQELESLLDEWKNEFHQFHISSDAKFDLGKICIRHQKYELGVELLYNCLMQNYNKYKLEYFGQSTIWSNSNWASPLMKLKKVELNTFVSVIITDDKGERKELFEVNETNLQCNKIVQAIFEKKLGEEIKLENSGFILNKISKTIKIANIAHKYVGMIWKICEEFDNPEENGLEGVALSLPKTKDNFLAEVNKIFMENFGLEGDLQNIRIKENERKYYNREISFTELLKQTGFHNKVLDYYHTLTQQDKGLVIMPIGSYEKIEISTSNKFVLDFTSLLLLKPLSEKYATVILPNNKFIISQYLVTYLENKLFEVENEKDMRMSLNITSQSVIPFLHKDEDKQNNINYVKSLLVWITENCEIKVSPKKLEYFEKQELFYEEDWYQNYMFDTLLLINEPNIILLSDDSFLYNMMQSGHIYTVSLEYFLQQTQPEIFTEKLLPYLIERNYLGITINSKNMIREFEKNKGKILMNGQTTSFDNCINILSFNYNYYINISEEVVKFLKYLYSDSSLGITYRQGTSRKVLYSFLKNMPEREVMANGLKFYAQYHFNLLGEHKDNVINDIDFAMDIIRRS